MDHAPVRTRKHPAMSIIDLTETGIPAPLSTPTVDRPDIAAVAASLCTMAEDLGALQRRHQHDTEVADQLDQLRQRTREAADVVVRVSGERRRAAMARSRTAHPAGGGITAREAAFAIWAASTDHLDRVLCGGQPVPVRSLLHEVLDSRRRLPDGAARALGVPTGTSTGCAAAWLIAAVDDPLGPRCRSFRAAVYYLGGRVEDTPLAD